MKHPISFFVSLLLVAMFVSHAAGVPTTTADSSKTQPPPSHWKNDIVTALNFSQVDFDNWSKGGEDNVAWLWNMTMVFEYDRPTWNWRNNVKLVFGKNRTNGREFRKSSDEINISTVFTLKRGMFVNPYISVNFETQFTRGYDYKKVPPAAISDFMDPGYVIISGGSGLAPVDGLRFRLGFASKTTITRQFSALYSDDPRTPDVVERIRHEPGMEVVTEVLRKVSANIVLASKLSVFSNLRSWEQVDVQWDTTFSSKIARFLSVNYNIQLWYDSDVSRKRQLKQALMVGITWDVI